MKNKRGWIKIVEAFIAVLLITSVLLIIINKGYIGGKDISQKVYDVQLSILREIELDDSLRAEILGVENIPVEVDENSEVYKRIENRKPAYLKCSAKICDLNVICALDNYPDTDVYVQSVAIATTLQSDAMRQLKLFCWRI